MLTRLPALLATHRPTFVTIEVSVNHSRIDRSITTAQTMINLGEMVTLCRFAGAIPVVVTSQHFDPTWFNFASYNASSMAKAYATNAAVRAFASEQGSLSGDERVGHHRYYPRVRLPSIDLLRVIVVVVIVWRHTYPGGDDQLLITTVAVPFFFFLTGWLWRPGKRTVAGEIENRWGTLGRPYVTWLSVLLLAVVAVGIVTDDLQAGTVIRPLAGGEYGVRPFTTFWFFTALFVAAVVMRLIEAWPTWALTVAMVVLITAGSLAGDSLSSIPLAIGTGIACVVFAIAGRLLSERASKPSRARVWVAAVVLPVAIVASYPFDHIDLKQGDFGTPMISAAISVACAWSAIILLDAAFARLPRASAWLSRALPPIATVAVVVVLVHPAVLWAVDAPTVHAPAWMFALALLVPWALAVALRSSPASRWFVGQDRRPILT